MFYFLYCCINFLYLLFYLSPDTEMNKVAPTQTDNSAHSLMEFRKRCKTKFKKEVQSEKICKICLEEEITQIEALEMMSQEEIQELEMIVPCECSGSMGYVHQKCIRTWIEKQLSNHQNKKIQCQICKTPFFFKIKKYKEFDCQLKNFSLISCCNILTFVIELSLLVVVILVYEYKADQYDTNMVKYILLSLMIILSISLGLTVMIMISQAFVKKIKTIGRIYTLEESLEMGLREPKKMSFKDIPTSSKKIKIRNKKNRARNSQGRPFFDSIIPNTNC